MNIKDTISEAVESLQEKAKNGSFWTKWFWYILAGVVGLILIGGLVLQAMHKSEKAAKAMHQRDVLIEKQHQEKTNSVVAKSEKKKQAHIKKAQKHLKKADAKARQAREFEAQAKDNKTRIDNLRNWDDVKKNVKY